MRRSRWLSISWLIAIGALGGLVGGCAAEPFTRPPLPDLHDPDPARIRAVFASVIPNQFTSEDTVVIDTLFEDIAVLGYLRVDRDARTFDLLGLNPAGVQLFLLYAQADQTQIKSVIGPLKDRPQVLLNLADDIRRIYFDLLPTDQAKVSIGAKTVRFTAPDPTGIIHFEFGDAPVVLLEKRHYRWFGVDWRVRYFDYDLKDGSCFPKGIVFDNRRLHYRIIIKNRAW